MPNRTLLQAASMEVRSRAKIIEVSISVSECTCERLYRRLKQKALQKAICRQAHQKVFEIDKADDCEAFLYI